MKSHFRFSKQQRNGIFLLVLCIVILQGIIYVLKSQRTPETIEDEELKRWRLELDSLAEIHKEDNRPEIYPFNPNFITDYKGYTLGMSTSQIDALHHYRAQDKWINSKEEFQAITGVSKAWLDSISPYFKFPDWVTSPGVASPKVTKSTKKTYEQKLDLNLASSNELQKVYGVGPKLSSRIIAYRESIEGGFASDVELIEIYGLDEEVISNILADFTVKTPRSILKIDINKASTEQLVTVPYIDYELAYRIIEYRTLHEGITHIEELTKIEDFPENKIKVIGLYLQF